MTGPRLLSPRWLAAGGITILAAVLGTVLLLQNGGSACAAPPAAALKKGVATYFSLEGTLGNCSFPTPPADGLFVALGPNQYAKSAACGTYLEVTGPKGKVRVKVIDSCPECPVGHLDLSLTAFKRIANPVAGRVPIRYRAVPGAAIPAPISLRVKEGSSKYWLSLLIDNHAHQLAAVKVAGPNGSFRTASREEWNFWTIPGGAGKGPFTVKIRDIYGRTVTVSHIKLAPGKTQKTSARLSAKPPKSHPRSTRNAAPRVTEKATRTPPPALSAATLPALSRAPQPTSTTAAAANTAPTAVDLAGSRSSCADR